MNVLSQLTALDRPVYYDPRKSHLIEMDKTMSLNKTAITAAAVASGALLASGALADTGKLEFPAPSPSCKIKQRIGITDVEIEYSRPSVKGRQIFGTVVPFGAVWRTGANAATKLVFSTPVKLNGNEIPAGTYALMTIPGKDEWTVIINKGSEQWGSYKYDEKSDVVRFKVKPVKLADAVETFTIDFDQIRDDSANIDLAWDKTEVPIQLQVEYIDKLKKQVADVMASDAKDKPYFQSALFYFNHDGNLEDSRKWIDAALAEKETFYMVYWKAAILNKLGDKAGALTAAKRSNELAIKANDNAYTQMSAELISKLK